MEMLFFAFNISHNFNITTLCKYLKQLQVSFLDNVSTNFVCDLYELSKATKQYNRLFHPLLKMKYAEVHTDLVVPIIS